jgi:hypothetical protein
MKTNQQVFIWFGFIAIARLNSALLGANFSGAETRPVNVTVRYLIRAAR